MKAQRGIDASVAQWLARDGLLALEWDVEAATAIVFALTSWQVWEQLVVDLGWSKERYAHHLCAALRSTLTGRRPA